MNRRWAPTPSTLARPILRAIQGNIVAKITAKMATTVFSAASLVRARESVWFGLASRGPDIYRVVENHAH